MSNKQPSKAKQVALSGMLFAMAMALSFIEGSLTFPGLLPGMKLGLANVVVMYALLFMGVRQALILDLLKALPAGTQAALPLGGLLDAAGRWLPFYALGLGWVCPALAGLAAGLVLRAARPRR